MTRAGAVAQRFFNLRGGSVQFDRMDAIMARVHPFGWHANLQLDGRDLPKYEVQIRRLPGKFVIDHVGKFLEPVGPEDEAFAILRKLLDTGRCWVKLSAPYETSKTGAPKYEDVSRLAREVSLHALRRENIMRGNVVFGSPISTEMVRLGEDLALRQIDTLRLKTANTPEQSDRVARVALEYARWDSILLPRPAREAGDTTRMAIGPQAVIASEPSFRSIISELASEDFPRLRVGIGSAGEGKLRDYVLDEFSAEEQPAIDQAIGKAVDALVLFCRDDLKRAMNQYNKDDVLPSPP
jgi:hypothetical protein